MSTLQIAARRVPTKLLALAVAAALAVAGTTAVLVTSGESAAGGQQHTAGAGPSNDGSQHPGRRP